MMIRDEIVIITLELLETIARIKKNGRIYSHQLNLTILLIEIRPFVEESHFHT